MAYDIFGRTAPGNIFVQKPENFKVHLSGGNFADIEPLIAQNIQWNYAQRVNRLYDLGKPDNVLMIAARPEGAMRIAHILADGGKFVNFCNKLGNPCNIGNGNNVLTISLPNGADKSTCDNPAATSDVKFHGCLLTSIGTSVAVTDYVISNAMDIMFVFIEGTGGGEVNPPGGG